MIQGRDETAINMPVGEKDVQQLFTQLSANDVEQFYAAFQLTMKRQQMEQLTHEIEQARQRVVDNEAKMLSVALPLITLVSLIELQASGVEDIDLLERMLERGEEWLDQTMQNFQRCKQLNMFDEGITLWCEHALDGAYDWIASMDAQESLENSLDQPDDGPDAVSLPSESNTTTEDQLLRKLMSDDDEERVASTTIEQTPPQPEQNEQPEQDEPLETPEAAIESEETEITEPEVPEESLKVEIAEILAPEAPEAPEESIEAEAAEIQKLAALEEAIEAKEAEPEELVPEEVEPEELVPEEEIQQAEEQDYDFSIPKAPVQETLPETLPDEPAAEALPAIVEATDGTAEISTEEPGSLQHTDEQAEAEQEPQELQEPYNTIAEQPIVIPDEATAEEWPYIYPEVLVAEKEPRLPAKGEQPVISNQPATVEMETPPHRSASILEAALQDMDAMHATNTMHTTQSQQTAQPIATESGQPQPMQSSHTQAPSSKQQRGRWQHLLMKLLGR